MGRGDLNYHGGEIRTPNIDGLAASEGGIRAGDWKLVLNGGPADGIEPGPK